MRRHYAHKIRVFLRILFWRAGLSRHFLPVLRSSCIYCIRFVVLLSVTSNAFHENLQRKGRHNNYTSFKLCRVLDTTESTCVLQFSPVFFLISKRKSNANVYRKSNLYLVTMIMKFEIAGLFTILLSARTSLIWWTLTVFKEIIR